MSDTYQQVAELLDLKGEVCPYTFVKSKLALEEMESGQVLKIIIDNLGSAANVPRSLSSEGHQILHVEKLNDTDWVITVKRG